MRVAALYSMLRTCSLAENTLQLMQQSGALVAAVGAVQRGCGLPAQLGAWLGVHGVQCATNYELGLRINCNISHMQYLQICLTYCISRIVVYVSQINSRVLYLTSVIPHNISHMHLAYIISHITRTICLTCISHACNTQYGRNQSSGVGMRACLRISTNTMHLLAAHSRETLLWMACFPLPPPPPLPRQMCNVQT